MDDNREAELVNKYRQIIVTETDIIEESPAEGIWLNNFLRRIYKLGWLDILERGGDERCVSVPVSDYAESISAIQKLEDVCRVVWVNYNEYDAETIIMTIRAMVSKGT